MNEDILNKYVKDLKEEIESVKGAGSKYYTGYLDGLKRALFILKCVTGGKT
jgi:hypothetical protein